MSGLNPCSGHLTFTFVLSQVEADVAAGVAGAVPVPHETSSREEVVAALEKNVLAAIAADRKITALKQLQVRRATQSAALGLRSRVSPC